jgi:cell division protein ZapA
VAVKNKVDVRIAGKDYTLVGVEADEYIQKVGLYVDRKMNEITRMNSKLSTSMAAVLTAINVADDFFKALESEAHLKKELKHVQEELERLRNEVKHLANENSALKSRNTEMQIELVKKETELNEVRNSLDKAARSVV